MLGKYIEQNEMPKTQHNLLNCKLCKIKTTNYEEMARNRNKTSIKIENNVQPFSTIWTFLSFFFFSFFKWSKAKELNLLNKVFGFRCTIMIHDTITIQIQWDGKFVGSFILTYSSERWFSCFWICNIIRIRAECYFTIGKIKYIFLFSLGILPFHRLSRKKKNNGGKNTLDVDSGIRKKKNAPTNANEGYKNKNENPVVSIPFIPGKSQRCAFCFLFFALLFLCFDLILLSFMCFFFFSVFLSSF